MAELREGVGSIVNCSGDGGTLSVLSCCRAEIQEILSVFSLDVKKRSVGVGSLQGECLVAGRSKNMERMKWMRTRNRIGGVYIAQPNVKERANVGGGRSETLNMITRHRTKFEFARAFHFP